MSLVISNYLVSYSYKEKKRSNIAVSGFVQISTISLVVYIKEKAMYYVVQIKWIRYIVKFNFNS